MSCVNFINCLFLFINLFVFITAENGPECRCVPVEQCPRVGAMSRADQQRYLEQFSCHNPRNDMTFVYGFSPIARGDHVCCTELQSDGSPQTTAFSNRVNQYRPSQKPNFNQYAGQQPQYNGPQDTRNHRRGFGPSQIRNSNPNSQQPPLFAANAQCQALTSFFPDPKFSCCGREASESDRTTGNSAFVDSHSSRNSRAPPHPSSPNNARTPQYPNGPNYAPYQPQSPPPQPWHNPGFAPPRYTRSTDNQPNVTVTIDTRISGGTTPELEQFPWTVLLKTTFDYGTKLSSFACGGSLISARFVLTAAHCVYDSGASVQDVEITLAEYDKRTFPTDCVTVRGQRRCIENLLVHAEDVISHPAYDDQQLQNDIAMIALQSMAPYSDYIRPICLPPIDVDATELKNLPLSVAGWGRNGRYTTNVKQYTVVNLVPQRECTQHYPQLTRRHLCAAGYSGEDTCKGDSGGPLMMFYQGRYFVSGVVSGKRSDSPCGSSVPSLYTNVYHYLDWINNVIKSDMTLEDDK